MVNLMVVIVHLLWQYGVEENASMKAYSTHKEGGSKDRIIE